MATATSYLVMNGDRALFPLFNKAAIPNEPNVTQPTDQGTLDINGLGSAHDEAKQQEKPAKTRKLRKKQVPGQKTLQEIVNPKAASSGNDSLVNGEAETDTQQDEASSKRSKRRRTSWTDSVEVGGPDEDDASPSQRHTSPQVIIQESSPLAVDGAPSVLPDKARTPPKKMLRLKAGGKFSSPMSKQPQDEDRPAEPVKRRGRPRKVKEAEQEKHLVAVVNYALETDIGLRIARILAGEERFKKQVKIVTKKQSTPRKAKSSAHPFFTLDRRKEQPQQPPQPSPRKTSAVTPGKLKREALNSTLPQTKHEPPEVWTSTLLKDRLMFKHPGSKEPAWPDKEQTHVRGLSPSDIEAITADTRGSTLQHRKRKTAKRKLSPGDSLLRHFFSTLEVEQDGKLRSDGFREPHPSLRLPTKHLISGQEILERVSSQLSVAMTDCHADELSLPDSSPKIVHGALKSVHHRILLALNALHEVKDEKEAWAHKYAPSSCSEVLQPARQTIVLKDWLSSLKVTAVDSTLRADSKVAKAESKPKKRKRRRKDDELDDFLVDSDEEVHDMDELTDPEDIPAPSQGRKALNSIVQVAAEGVKLSNAVLLSGPHGCGKTAAAYAAAKELNFKVFEISSSERRSGKDVLDKVGNMTENHLVKHHGTESGEQSSTEEANGRLDEAFQRDLASGRQGKMASFLQPQVKAKPKPKAALPTEKVRAKAVEAVQNVVKKPPKDQQQSLILLEEVDVLFKEDKDFWTTIFKLIATSKRPFIMTCNDEDLVPLQAMSLHAILRFTPQPIDLATDYLLLVAAAEAHLLRRDDVSSLYMSKGCDLRAAISELDLWCQMGVGDPRGGLSWIYQRYPPGSDLDEKGRRLRVVSEDTYHEAMACFAERAPSYDDKIMWSFLKHAIDPSAAVSWQDLSPADTGDDLKHFTSMANELSASDVYARGLCSAQQDLTQKPMGDKARAHYIEGLPLLQSDEQADFSGLRSELLATSTLLTFQAYDMLSSEQMQARLNKPDMLQSRDHADRSITRHAFACFDAISAPVESALATVSGLQQSVFDGPLEPIATDIAPYVRSIVHFDLALAEQREALGGGKSAKRARTTRAARSALEGGQRASTRRERWFPKQLDLEAVLSTAGEGWPKMLAVAGGSDVVEGGDDESVPASSAGSV